MAKPTITTRAGKGSPLTSTEVDSNFTNVKDATFTLEAGTAGTDVVSDLNGIITLVAGTNISLSGDNIAKTVTITNTASAGGSGIVTLKSASYYISFPNTANGNQTSNWSIHNDGGIAGVSASTNTFTLPAGTYTMIWPFSRSTNANYYNDVILRNTTDSVDVFMMTSIAIPMPSTAFMTYQGQFTFTIAGTKTFTFRTAGAAGAVWYLTNGQSDSLSFFAVQIIKSS
jgi:hypothetical protein